MSPSYVLCVYPASTWDYSDCHSLCEVENLEAPCLIACTSGDLGTFEPFVVSYFVVIPEVRSCGFLDLLIQNSGSGAGTLLLGSLASVGGAVARSTETPELRLPHGTTVLRIVAASRPCWSEH